MTSAQLGLISQVILKKRSKIADSIDNAGGKKLKNVRRDTLDFSEEVSPDSSPATRTAAQLRQETITSNLPVVITTPQDDNHRK